MFLEIERYLAKRTTKIIALSELQRDELVNEFKIAPKDKFAIVPLGFDLSRFETDKENKRKSFRAKYNILEDEIAIGIVGRLVPIKNHELFLNAIHLVAQRTQRKIRVFIIGDGELRANIEAMATKLGLKFDNTNPTAPNLLTFTSWIKEIDVSNAGMDIIALTSKNEGTPVSLIEAQASGKPIVSTTVGGIENIVLENVTALLSPKDDVEAFAQNLLKLIEDDYYRLKIAQDGSDFVRQKFSHHRLCSDMSNLYNSLLAIKKQ
jgi:glycosyltransferase involved in cell wall biosynthesis